LEDSLPGCLGGQSILLVLLVYVETATAWKAGSRVRQDAYNPPPHRESVAGRLRSKGILPVGQTRVSPVYQSQQGISSETPTVPTAETAVLPNIELPFAPPSDNAKS
jgi:hypothetical protein